MLDGLPLVDAYVHAARLPTLKPAWQEWAADFGDESVFGQGYDSRGTLDPHLHYPVDEELERQIALGAVALKIHPVHGGFAANDRALYPAYAICQDARSRVVVQDNPSTFPTRSNSFAAL